MPLLPQCTSLLLKSNGANIQTLRNQIHNLSTTILPKKPHQTYPSSQYLFIYLLNK